LVKILGLRYQHKYQSLDELRYGKLMVMADQDVDGSHIKVSDPCSACRAGTCSFSQSGQGLVLNFINFHWPDLLKLGFVVEFITPIIKVPIAA
jgi:DNA topoisomerase-2